SAHSGTRCPERRRQSAARLARGAGPSFRQGGTALRADAIAASLAQTGWRSLEGRPPHVHQPTGSSPTAQASPNAIDLIDETTGRSQCPRRPNARKSECVRPTPASSTRKPTRHGSKSRSPLSSKARAEDSDRLRRVRGPPNPDGAATSLACRILAVAARQP